MTFWSDLIQLILLFVLHNLCMILTSNSILLNFWGSFSVLCFFGWLKNYYLLWNLLLKHYNGKCWTHFIVTEIQYWISKTAATKAFEELYMMAIKCRRKKFFSVYANLLINCIDRNSLLFRVIPLDCHEDVVFLPSAGVFLGDCRVEWGGRLAPVQGPRPAGQVLARPIFWLFNYFFPILYLSLTVQVYYITSTCLYRSFAALANFLGH